MTFSGNPKMEWLPDGRNMRLLEEFTYTDPDGKVWVAPKDAVVNGASIPRPLWTVVGSPYVGGHRNASIVHDVACGDPEVPRKEADVMFYHACRAGGCNLVDSRILYGGVRVGAWSSCLKVQAAEDNDGMTKKFTDVLNEIRVLPKKASLEDVDAAIEKVIPEIGSV